MFDTTRCGRIRTEVIEGLYHRKLRTITGTGEIRTASGRTFVRAINQHGTNFPVEALYQGFAAMPWQDMIDEFEQLEVIELFERITAFEAKRHFDQALVRLSDYHENSR